MRVLRVERHPHGPRVRVLGVRVHEWHLGAVVLAATGVAIAAGLVVLNVWGLALLALGSWMIVKDWRDLLPHTRDTATWSLGPHRRLAPLRAIRYAEGLSTFAAAVAFAVGVVNLVSALTPNIAWRGHLLLLVLPIRAVPVFHSLAVPASLALIVTARSLGRRRRRALHVAVALLVVLGAFDVLKGLDLEESALSWAAAGLLWWGRDAFPVRPAPVRRRAVAVIAAALGVAFAAAFALSWFAGGRAWSDDLARQTFDLFTWTKGAVTFRDELSWVPLGVGLLTLTFIAVVGYVLFRPLPPPRALPDTEQRAAAERLVRRFGSDTLAFFKLRRDLHYLFTDDNRAFLGYRIEHDVLVVAGDPVGPADALPALLTATLVFAEMRGLQVAVLGASEPLLALWRAAGLRSLYLGSEAVIETARFSLEGRSIRKVRQSVTRVERAGYTASARRLRELDSATLLELDRVSKAWRAGAPERGFSMALDAIGGAQQADSVVVLARDEAGTIRAFLHFVPAYGREAMSLSFMRRERDTPNGLTEFLVVRGIESLRELGIAELSLNFAAFGRLLERPSGRVERVLARCIRLGNRYFQIESLYSFNAKFMPRWEPRYLLFESLLGLPRVGLAAMRVEGQLPTLRAS
jgi:lysyl-tRNA synthetase class 2